MTLRASELLAILSSDFYLCVSLEGRGRCMYRGKRAREMAEEGLRIQGLVGVQTPPNSDECSSNAVSCIPRQTLTLTFLQLDPIFVFRARPQKAIAVLGNNHVWDSPGSNIRSLADVKTGHCGGKRRRKRRVT